MNRLPTLTFALFAGFSLRAALAAQSTDDGPAPVPKEVSASDWTSIRAAYEAGRHAAFAIDGGYQARNPGNNGRRTSTAPARSRPAAPARSR